MTNQINQWHETIMRDIQDWKTSTPYKPQPYRFNDSFELKQNTKQKAEWINTAITVSLVLAGVCFFSLSIYAASGAALADSAMVVSVKPLIGLAAGSAISLCIAGVLKAVAGYSGIERNNRLMNNPSFQQFVIENLTKDGRLPDKSTLLDPSLHNLYCRYMAAMRQDAAQA